MVQFSLLYAGRDIGRSSFLKCADKGETEHGVLLPSTARDAR